MTFANSPSVGHPSQVASEILEACELAIARGQPSMSEGTNPRLHRVLNQFLPMELATNAARPSLVAFGLWATVLLASAGAAYLLVKPWGFLQPRDLDSYFVAWSFLLTLCFVLARPSKLSLPGWALSDLVSAKARCMVLAELTESEIASVQFFVGYAEAGTRRRISALWWITGAVWAVSAYLLQKGFEGRDGSMFATAVLPLIGSLLCAGLIASYSRSVSQVHGMAYALLLDRLAQVRSATVRSASRVRRNGRQMRLPVGARRRGP